jgi:ribosome maturation factor RimP
MLKNDLKDNELYQLLKPVADGLEMTVVEVQKQVLGASETKVVITVMKNDGQTSIDDLEKFHRSVQSLLELKIGREVLSMEVGTPGLERNLKDYSEFGFFKGRNAKIYDSSFGQWLEGTILDSDGSQVKFLTSEDVEMNIPFDHIHKARLDYKWTR